MAYRFKRGDASMRKAIRRIALEQVDKAIAETHGARDAERAVHQARKRCKKLRGLVRLVRPAFADYAAENAAFRDAAAALSPLRDSAVMAATYDALMAAYGDQVDRRALASIRAHATRSHREACAGGAAAAALEAYAEAMGRARDRVRRWRLETDGFDALGAGLAFTYARGCRAMRQARGSGRDADFHDWRKRVKYHGYHVRLLVPLWPGPLGARLDETGRLGDLLGAHHDLAVFAAALEAEPAAWGEPADIDVALGLVQRRKLALARDALELGPRLHAESADALCARLRAYWQAWRREGR